MTAVPFGFPRFIVRDPTTDAPLAGGRVFTFVAGTASTPKVAYADAQGIAELPNPFTLDADGGREAFFEGSYKIRVERADGSLVYEIDGVGAAGGTAEGEVFGPYIIITNNYSVTPSADKAIFQATRPTDLTMSFAASAELGPGFFILVKNTGSGQVIFDPYQTETIDGGATKPLPPGASVMIYCDGASLFTVLQTPSAGEGLAVDDQGVFSVAGGDGIDMEDGSVGVDGTVVRVDREVLAGNGLVGGGDFSGDRSFALGTPGTITSNTSNEVTSDSHTHALSIGPADVIPSARGVLGSYALVTISGSFSDPFPGGSTMAGADLQFAVADGGASGTAPSGTWRNMAGTISSTSVSTIAVRIA